MEVNMKIEDLYKKDIKKATKLIYGIPDSILDGALNYSIEKRRIQTPVKVDNNYTKKSANIMLEELTNWILAKEPIVTAWGVMFKKKGEVPNPLGNMIFDFMANRDINKGKMFQFPKGSEDFAHFFMLQILDKLDANATYGVLSNSSSLLYNLYIAASITTEGRALISTAIIFFEAFLSNNVKFGSLEEIITFINNVVGERKERRFKDDMLLDRNVTVEECFTKLVYSIGDFRYGKIKWVPDEEDLDIIWRMLNNLGQEDINRLYYKNNLFAFIDNQAITKAFVSILCSLNEPFLNPNKPPKEISVELDTLQDILAEYVYYHHQIIDVIDRNVNMIKNVTAISDTDSAIVCFDGFYRYILYKIGNIPMNIKKVTINAFKYCNGDVDYIDAFSTMEPVEDFDFFNDEITQVYRMARIFDVIPQDGLRHSIINVIAYICGNLVNDYILRFCKNSNAYVEGEKCQMYLKNEFLFKRALLTMNKKNYASKQELQEGHEVPEDESLDIKGLPIKKSTLNPTIQQELQKILYDDILNTTDINQLQIIKHMAILEKKIFKSLASGSKEFYKPLAIKSQSSYDDPMRIQGIKASVIWNKVRDENLPAIDLTERNSIDVVKVNITPENIYKIKDNFPDAYNKIQDLFNSGIVSKIHSIDNATSKEITEITAIAIPKDTAVPKWILEFIDYTTIINDNLCNFPLESVGISKTGSDSVNYTNIIQI